MKRKYVVYDIPARKIGFCVIEDIEDDELDAILDDAVRAAEDATGPVDDPIDEFFAVLDEAGLDYFEEEADWGYDDALEIRITSL